MSFLNTKKPFLTAMIQCHTADDCIEKIKKSHKEGAEAFGIQLCQLYLEERSEEHLKRIFAACEGKPIYITSYHLRESENLTEEDCVELLLRGLKCGATLCDVRGDQYDPCECQLTKDMVSVKKQKALIDEIHRLGGEVLMSTHDFRPLSCEDVIAVAKEQLSRGADIIKIVIKNDDENSLPEAIKTISELKKLGRKFLFLDIGACAKVVRRLGPSLGVCMYLCVDHHGELDTPEQPLICEVKYIRDNLNF